MKLTINVTQEDIDKGIVTSSFCPIARAIRRQINPYHVSVGTTRIAYWKNSLGRKDPNEVIIKTPERAEQFINVFDKFGKDSVSPFSFEIEVPE